MEAGSENYYNFFIIRVYFSDFGQTITWLLISVPYPL